MACASRRAPSRAADPAAISVGEGVEALRSPSEPSGNGSSQASSLLQRGARSEGVEPRRGPSGRHSQARTSPPRGSDPELHGDGRLADPELRGDDLDHRARRLFALGEDLQDPPPHRVAEHVERVHVRPPALRCRRRGNAARGVGLRGVLAAHDRGVDPGGVAAGDQDQRLGVGRGARPSRPRSGPARRPDGHRAPAGTAPSRSRPRPGPNLAPCSGVLGSSCWSVSRVPSPSSVSVDVHPAHVAVVLPGDREVSWHVAGEHLPTGVALELVAPAGAEVAGHRHQPAGIRSGSVSASQTSAAGDGKVRVAVSRLTGSAVPIDGDDPAADGAEVVGGDEVHGAIVSGETDTSQRPGDPGAEPGGAGNLGA